MPVNAQRINFEIKMLEPTIIDAVREFHRTISTRKSCYIE